MVTDQHDTIKKLLKDDPGNPEFADYATSLREKGSLMEALHVLLAGLSANPTFQKGRLTLARVFYELGFIPFAVRELEILREELPDNRSIQKLLLKLAPEKMAKPDKTTASSKDSTVAESDFELDDLDALDEE